MNPCRYVVMGAGEVGFHLAQALSKEGHDVTVIEIDGGKQARVSDELDVLLVAGNGAHVAVLERAGVDRCDLFMAVTSSDEANLAASLLARKLGAARSVVRVRSADEVVAHREIYERLFGADLLLSTQLLTTTQVINHVRGYNTTAVEYLAGGRLQLRKTRLDDKSPLIRKPLKEVELPKDSLIVALFRGDSLVVPSGEDKARPGDDALILGKTEVINRAERMVSAIREAPGTVMIAGGGTTTVTVAKALEGLNVDVKIIERDGRRAGYLASRFPNYQILHGDATDDSLLKAERVGEVSTFLALTGSDEQNLMACLLAQDMGVRKVLPVVRRAENSQLWRRLGLAKVFSPRVLAYERIREYIKSGYTAAIVSLRHGAAQVLERRLAEASPVAGASLAEVGLPRGLIVGAVVRGDSVFIPRGSDHLQVRDRLLLFVQQKELDKLQIFFPGHDET